MAKTKQMMETDKKGIKRQFFPVTHAGAVLGLKEFLEGDFFQADFDRVMALLEERSDKAFAEIDKKSDAMEKHADEKINEFDNKIAATNQTLATLEKEIYDTQQTFEKMDVYTKAETDANVIYQVIGKDEVEMTLTFDLKNKIASSDVENPNSASFRAGPTLYNPNQFTADAYINYLSLYSLDGTLLKLSNSTQGNIAQVCIIVNILEELQRFLGQQFFIDRGAVTEEQKVAVLEMIVTEFTSNIYGFGVGTSGNLLTQKNWYGAWTEGETTTANTVTRIGRKFTNSDNNWSKYINGGKIPILITTGESDGITSSSINLDYANVEVKLKLSANEHIKLMIAANRVENLATQEEAETGEDNKKIMTPLRVMQSIKKFVENKFVSIAGNETIGGLKNFRDGLMVNGNNVLAHKGVVTIKYSNADFPTEIASGYITFVRYGDEVQAVFNFKTRIGNDFAKDQSIIWGIAADFQADTSEPQYIGITSTGGTTSIVKFTEGGSTLTAHSILLKDTWYAGTVTYLAKNKLQEEDK